MGHVSDFTQSEEAIILDLINADNASNLTLEIVSLGTPRMAAGAAVNVQVSPKPGSGYGGPLDVTYNRLSIQDFIDLYFEEGLTLSVGDALKVSDFLDEVNVALGTNLLPTSIVDSDIGDWEGLPNEVKSVSLTIVAGSLVYRGAGALSIKGADISIPSLITKKVLTGLNLPNPAPELSSLFTTPVLDLY